MSYEWFVGIDGGSQQHQVWVLDLNRHVVGERVVDHDGSSLAQLATWLLALSQGQPHRVSVALAVPRGAMVAGLIERGLHVLAIHPKPRDRFRARHRVAGAKDDRRDACVLADAMRTEQPSFRRLRLDEPRLLMLRELSRAEAMLLAAFRRTANRLREPWHRFYPPMLHLSAAADEAWLWDLIARAPTPSQAALVTDEQVRHVLTSHRIRRVTAQEVMVG